MNNNNRFQLREYNGTTIRQREDGFLDLTAIAKIGGIALRDWWRLPSVLRYLNALAKKLDLPTLSHEELSNVGNRHIVKPTGKAGKLIYFRSNNNV